MNTSRPLLAAAAVLATAGAAHAQLAQPARPAGSRTILAPRNTTTLPAAQPAQPAAPARTTPGAVAARDVAAQAGTNRLLCRGSTQPQISSLVEAGPPPRGMTTLIFSPSAAPGSQGSGLEPGECVLEGVSGYYPPAVRFPQDWDVLASLTDAGKLVAFDVIAKHGYYEAVATRPIGNSAGGGDVPNNLFELDPRTRVQVGDRQFAAGDLQRNLRETALASAPPSHNGNVQRTARAAASIASQAPPVAGPRTIGGAAPIGSTMAGSSAQRASQLDAASSVNCDGIGPRVKNTQTRVVPGQSLGIAGSCFGKGGIVEIRGSFPGPGRTVRLAETRWTSDRIDALVPTMSGVTDQTITVSVVRDDGRRSTGVAFPFRAARERVRVPAERWRPSANPYTTTIREGDTNPFGSEQQDRAYNTAHSRGGAVRVSASVTVNAACALEDLEYAFKGAQMYSVQEWGEAPTPNEQRVTLTGRAACSSTQNNTLYIVREWKQVCSYGADFGTWASCPVGVAP